MTLQHEFQILHIAFFLYILKFLYKTFVYIFKYF